MADLSEETIPESVSPSPMADPTLQSSQVINGSVNLSKYSEPETGSVLKDQKVNAERRERKPPVYSSPLPPCKICGGKASGLHYGVNTCEACKGFFRRAIKYQRKYHCFRKQRCDVVGGRSVRTSCPFCRLQKCLDMGMAHSAIKTGRYTHAKRTENIMEVKRLELHPTTMPSKEHHQESAGSSFSGGTSSIDSCGSHRSISWNSSKNRANSNDSFLNCFSSRDCEMANDIQPLPSYREIQEGHVSYSENDIYQKYAPGDNKLLGDSGDIRNFANLQNSTLLKDDTKVIPPNRTEEKSPVGDDFPITDNNKSYWSNRDSSWAVHEIHTPEVSMENSFFGGINQSSIEGGFKERDIYQAMNNSDSSRDVRDRFFSQQNEHRHDLGVFPNGTTEGDIFSSQDSHTQHRQRGNVDNHISIQPRLHHSQFHTHSKIHHPHYFQQQLHMHHGQHFSSAHHNNPAEHLYDQDSPVTSQLVKSKFIGSATPYAEVANEKVSHYQPTQVMSHRNSLTSASPSSIPIKSDPFHSNDNTNYHQTPDNIKCQDGDNVESIYESISSPKPIQDVRIPEIITLKEASGLESNITENFIKHLNQQDPHDILHVSNNITTSPSSVSALTSSFALPICIDKTEAVVGVGTCDHFSSSFTSMFTSTNFSTTSTVVSSRNMPISPAQSLSPSAPSTPSPSLLAPVSQKHPSDPAGSSEEPNTLPHGTPSIASPQTSPTTNTLLVSQEMQLFPTHCDQNAFLQSVPDLPLDDQARKASMADSNSLETVQCMKPTEANLGSSLDGELFQVTVGIIEAAYHKYTLTLFGKDPEILYQYQLDYLKQHKARLDTFGLQTEFIKDEDYEEIFERTGLDIDNRKEQISIINRGTTKFFQNLTRFALEVPGFDTLLPSDMVELIYGSFTEMWFLHSFSGVNSDLRVLIMPMGKPYTQSEVGWIMSKEFADIVFQQAPSFKMLTLNNTIMALWKTVVLLASDRSSLKESSRVCQLQQFYLDLLKHYTRNVWPCDPGLLGRILNATVRLRDVSHRAQAPRSFTVAALKADIMESIRSTGVHGTDRSVSGDVS